ncbi:MAG: hypothetical protein CBD26_03695 [Candidatus Pelagibacter sp. TMED166]|nr:MAG: hypothetical protein CBD26_03695 [Candidatus Pelagibacter sp. TMED166]|tara:strand:+ start:1966 stop:2370 length:405 start_codon:yes stop_codon:yes gene_type:complete
MKFEIINVRDRENVDTTKTTQKKIKVRVTAPKRQFATDKCLSFTDEEKVVDFLSFNGYTFDSWQCLKAESVNNFTKEENRSKDWTFVLIKNKPPAAKTVKRKVEKVENIDGPVEQETAKPTRRRTSIRQQKKKD